MTPFRIEPRLASGLHRPPSLNRGDPAFQAYALLHLGFAAFALINGVLMWSRGRIAMGFAHAAAGVLIAVRPSWGAALYGAWMLAVAFTLASAGAGLIDESLTQAAVALGLFGLSRIAAQAGR